VIVEVALILGLAIAMAAVGVRLGMLVARPLERFGRDADEEPGDHD
jgi:hypothetical protein